MKDLFFPSAPINRMQYLKSWLAIVLVSFIAGVLAGVMPGASVLVGGVAGLFLGIVGIFILVRRIQSCFQSTAAIIVALLLSFIPFVPLVWFLWPPRETLLNGEHSNNTLLAVILGLILAIFFAGIVVGVSKPAYDDYLKRSEQAKMTG